MNESQEYCHFPEVCLIKAVSMDQEYLIIEKDDQVINDLIKSLSRVVQYVEVTAEDCF